MWQFNNATWEQDDSFQTFRLKTLNGRECLVDPVAPLTLLIDAKKHKTTSNLNCSSGIFPAEFNNCPYCGNELSSTLNRSSFAWIPPYGNGSGFKIFSKELKPESFKKSKGESFAIPSNNGRFSFCSIYFGAKHRLLIALQRDIGKLSVSQSGTTNSWRDLSGIVGEDNLPEWSWAIATDSAESGLAIPGAEGPAWVTIDWSLGKLQIDRGDGRSIGGAVKLGKFIFAPVLRGDKLFVLSRKEGDAGWSECMTLFDVSKVSNQLCRQKQQAAFFGIPVIDETRMVVYWPCRGGYLKVKEKESGLANEQVWDFRTWETDDHPATALIELGPPYRKSGSRAGFWQLCEDHDNSQREGVVNKLIKLDGDESVDSEISEYGQFVSTGRASFTWLNDFWNDVHQLNSIQSENKELRYPLLQFGDKGLTLIAKVKAWQGREEVGLFSDIFYNHLEKASVFVRFVIQGSSVPEIALYKEGDDGSDITSGSLFKLSLTQLPELSVFIFDGRLYIYFPEQSICYRWPLDMTES